MKNFLETQAFLKILDKIGVRLERKIINLNPIYKFYMINTENKNLILFISVIYPIQ